MQQLSSGTDLPQMYQLRICLGSSGELIGDCGLHSPEDKVHEAELGITLAPEHRRKGYATETLMVIMRYLFRNLGKDRIYATVHPRNHAAIRLVERLGLKVCVGPSEPPLNENQIFRDVVYEIREEGSRKIRR
jgi:RimJ/RimL family protein N-acetyltransferase